MSAERSEAELTLPSSPPPPRLGRDAAWGCYKNDEIDTMKGIFKYACAADADCDTARPLLDDAGRLPLSVEPALEPEPATAGFLVAMFLVSAPPARLMSAYT